MHDVFGKIQVLASKGATDIVILCATARNQLLELGNNNLIAPLSVYRGTHVVVDSRTAVQR